MPGRRYEIGSRRPSAVFEEAAGAGVDSVSAFTRRIKDVLEGSIPPGWVRGEVSNLRLQASGHTYFSLKDAEAQISCVLFRGDAVRSAAGASLRDGAQVIAFGSISVYEPRGNYQLIVRAVVDDGVGRLRLEFERLKQRLAVEGLFDPSRKRKLPQAPRTIGFVTSPTGAAAQDFIRILKRRGWLGRVVILPVKVQGEGAAADIVAMLDLAASLGHAPGRAGPRFDVLVIGRGGGSFEDLWVFNEEPVVRAVARCPMPVISAVGHEIDFTLCDFAADVRAETPSGAAELISSSFLEFARRVLLAGRQLDDVAGNRLRTLREAVKFARASLQAVSPRSRLEHAALRLDDMQNRMDAAARHLMSGNGHRMTLARARLLQASPSPHISRVRERTRALAERLVRETDRALAAKRNAMDEAAARLATLSPGAVQRRGFVILSDAAGRPVTSKKSVSPGDRLHAAFHDGTTSVRAE